MTESLRNEVTSSRGWTSSLWPKLEGVTRSKHFDAMKNVEKAVVFCWPAVIDVPNEFVADYARSHEEKVIGFASVDPLQMGAPRKLRRAVTELGLKGLKLYPITQHFFPNDKKLNPICEIAQEMEIPILWHLSPIFRRSAPLKYSQPLLLEDLALDFPDLRMIVAHLGFPNEVQVFALMRKQPNIYAEISGCTTQPYRFYNSLIAASDYGVADKILFGSDWPLFTFEETVDCLRRINLFAENTNLPRISSAVIDRIIEGNAQAFLKL